MIILLGVDAIYIIIFGDTVDILAETLSHLNLYGPILRKIVRGFFSTNKDLNRVLFNVHRSLYLNYRMAAFFFLFLVKVLIDLAGVVRVVLAI